MSHSHWVVDVTAANFREEVVERSLTVPVIVDFWAEWCGPCRVLGPLLEKLVNERDGGVILAKVDIDKAQALAAQFGIQSVPTVISFKDGRPDASFMGAVPEPDLRRFIDDLAPAKSDPNAAAAALLEGADPAEAEAGYRSLLAADAGNATAAVGLARLLIERGDRAEAGELLAKVPTDSDHKEEVERLQATIALRELAHEQPPTADLRARLDGKDDAEGRYALGLGLARDGDYAAALEALFQAGQADRAIARGQGREAMVAVFAALGQGHELTKTYRRKLAGLLF